MNSPRYARLIAEVFKRAEPRASDVSPRSNRDEEIALIERAMDNVRRRGRRSRVAAAWSVAAALILAGLGVGRAIRENRSPAKVATASGESNEVPAVASPVAIAIASGGGAIVAAPGSSAPAVAGRALQAGSRLLVDPNAGATLSLSTGTHLEVGPGSQLSVVEDSRAQIFALNAGSLRADVAKLAKDARFIVRTPDAEVEVRGTSFLVDVVAPDATCGAGTTTRVAVYEGVVTVRAGGQEDFIARGEQWPRGCRPVPALPASAHVAIKRAAKIDAPPAGTPVATTTMAGNSAADSQAVGALPAPRLPMQRVPPSSLAEENNLFAEGMLARRTGNVPLAVDKMDRFLERYPSSHLAENAAAERMRLLRALDATRATSAARQYLQRYPSGFARGEAEAIVAGMR
ncbi:MAG TPA: FecR domain-containing protein [Polyangiaceae bacterium]|nr:FecR domain-containing protein [Polyangiaceae bacterium]